MAEDKQLTVAELLARARKDNPDAGTPKRRRRRSLEDGGISVAELTGSFPAVTDAPPQAKHTAVSIDGEEKPSTPAKTPQPEARKPAEAKKSAEKPSATTPAETKKPEPKKPAAKLAATTSVEATKPAEAKKPVAKPAEATKSAEPKKPEPKTPVAKAPAATPAETKKPAQPKKPTDAKKPAEKTSATTPAESKKPKAKTPAESKKPEAKTPAVETPATTSAGPKKPAEATKPAEPKKPEPKTPAAKTPAEAKKPPAAPTKPAATEAEDDAKTGVLKKVDAQEPKTAPVASSTPKVEDTGVMPAVGDSAEGGNVRVAERPRTDVEQKTDEESGGNAVAVIGMAVVGVVLGAVVFFVFEMLWGALNPWLTGALALVVTVAMIFAVRALRTTRDSMTMTLAGLVGLVTTFGPALISL